MSKGKMRAAVGETVTIRLDSNPTTGYMWQVDSAEGLIVRSEFKAPKTELCGAPGIHVFEITAAKPGTYDFKAVYKRSWEPEPIQECNMEFEFFE